MEPAAPLIEINTGPNRTFILVIHSKVLKYIDTSLLHLSKANITACSFHEFSYSLPIEIKSLETREVNNSYEISNCTSQIEWNPAHTDILIGGEFGYLISDDPNVWVVKSKNKTISNLDTVSGIN